MKRGRVSNRFPARRGVALLIVLLGVVGIASLLTAMARDASTAAQTGAAAWRTRIADDLLAACESPIHHWLHERAAGTVLPPEIDAPSALLLNDTFRLGSVPVRVTILATDELGTLRPGADRSAFLNVATAPRSVLEATVGAADPTSLAAILEARGQGLSPIANGTITVENAHGQARVRLTNVSDAWSMRIDVAAGDVRRVWHARYARIEGGWICAWREGAL